MVRFTAEVMKPRIFIAIHYMHLGGAEISLMGLLQALDPKKVDIDLFVYSHEGELMKLIPEYVNLLPEDKTWSMFEKPLKEVFLSGEFRIGFARLRNKYLCKAYMKQPNHNPLGADCSYLGFEVSKVLPDVNSSITYDLAISFLTPHNFVLDHVKANKKLCWIHTDYTRVGVVAELEKSVWEQYDYIASISPEVTKTFLQVFPSCGGKVIEIENILSPDFVRHRAEDFVADWSEAKDEKTLRILSIGRFSEQKNFDNLPFIYSLLIEEMKNILTVCHYCDAKGSDSIPGITRRIIESGCDIKWYIIGFGSNEALIRQKIAEAGMQDHVIILGKKENPYPYIKACDIYVQPSRYEGKSVTVREAQMLCKPVVVTNYPTANSQIRDGVDGVIVPMDNEECAKGLAEFILDEAKQSQIIEFLKTHDYGNLNEVNKIYDILGL